MNNKITYDISRAVAALKNGDLVAFPTETVYGLGADARDSAAIRNVFAAKGRPGDHPLIVHIGTAEEMQVWARDIPDSAWTLAQHFWPGPLTLILRKHPAVSDLITGGQDSIALRIPAHPVALQLLQAFGSALVGPSANIYGHVSPTTAQHVIHDLHRYVTLVLDGGPCIVGIESTIVNLLEKTPKIMRQGAISAAELSTVLQQDVSINNDAATVRTSGSHVSHYAPRTPTFILPLPEILQKVAAYSARNLQCSVISFQEKPDNIATNVYWHTESFDPKIYAQYLYANLRAHDQHQGVAILIEQIPHIPAWAAIADRLSRASFKK
jgi:L-threonylcarbamoyladenylate synthase